MEHNKIIVLQSKTSPELLSGITRTINLTENNKGVVLKIQSKHIQKTIPEKDNGVQSTD